MAGTAAIIGGIITNILYLRDAMRGTKQPHAFTWLVWGLNACIAAGLGFWGQAYISAAAFAVNGLFYLLFCVAALKHKTRPNTKSDWAALIVSLSILPIWAMTNEALLAAILVSLIGYIGAIPTLRKTWTYPYEENALGFGFYSLMSLLGLLAVSPVTWVTALYPVTCLIVNTSVFVVTLLRRWALSSSTAA